MKKHFLSLAFVLIVAITQAQPWADSTITLSGVFDVPYDPLATTSTIIQPGGRRVYTYIYPGPGIIAMEDSRKVELLLDQAKAILERDTEEFILLSVLCSHIAEQDFYEYWFLEVFPITLALHIERKTPYAIAAAAMKRRYFPERD